MDPQTSVSPSGIEAALRDLKPVAVTRWSARLADAQCERDYRMQRFADDRRRLLLLMGLVAAAAVFIFLGRLYEYWYYGSAPEPLYPPLVSIFIPLCGDANLPPAEHAAVAGDRRARGRQRRLQYPLAAAYAAARPAGDVAAADGDDAVRHLSLSADPLHRLGRVRRDVFAGHAVLVGVAGASGAAGPGNLSRHFCGCCSPTRSALPPPMPCSAASACNSRRACCCASCCRPTR